MLIILLTAFPSIKENAKKAKEGRSPSAEPVADPAPVAAAPVDVPWSAIIAAILILAAIGITIWALYTFTTKIRVRKQTLTGLVTEYEQTSKLHSSVKTEYGAILADLITLCEIPAITDITNPYTATFITSYNTTNTAETKCGMLTVENVTNYTQQTHVLQTDWDACLTNAKRLGLTAVPLTSREPLRKAKHLLNLAVNTTNADEATTATVKALALLKPIMTIPETAITAIEHQTRTAITT